MLEHMRAHRNTRRRMRNSRHVQRQQVPARRIAVKTEEETTHGHESKAPHHLKTPRAHSFFWSSVISKILSPSKGTEDVWSYLPPLHSWTMGGKCLDCAFKHGGTGFGVEAFGTPSNAVLMASSTSSAFTSPTTYKRALSGR